MAVDAQCNNVYHRASRCFVQAYEPMEPAAAGQQQQQRQPSAQAPLI